MYPCLENSTTGNAIISTVHGTILEIPSEITPPFKACKGNWPMKNRLPKELPNVGKKNKPVTRLKHLMKQKDDKNLAVEEKFEILKEALILAYEVLKPPHLIICNIESEFYNQLRIMH